MEVRRTRQGRRTSSYSHAPPQILGVAPYPRRRLKSPAHSRIPSPPPSSPPTPPAHVRIHVRARAALVQPHLLRGDAHVCAANTTHQITHARTILFIDRAWQTIWDGAVFAVTIEFTDEFPDKPPSCALHAVPCRSVCVSTYCQTHTRASCPALPTNQPQPRLSKTTDHARLTR
jgi:hypothetical protein